MKKNLLYIAIILITAASCVKDRTAPATGPTQLPTGDTLMYFWSFNKADSTKRNADFSRSGAIATFTYNSAYIDYTGGSNLNLIGITDSGQCLRVRNPATNVIFYMPTTGFDSVVMKFAEEASSSGPSINAISYTTDGTTFKSTALNNTPYNVTTSFVLQTFNFTSDPSVNNNPKFAVMITFVNNNAGTSGNDRIDNVSLSGVKH